MEDSLKGKKDPAVFCVTSGKGGVGKTSLTLNLGFALAEKGDRVLVVDGDLGLANIDVMLGVSVQRTIRDVLDKGIDPLETIIYPKSTLGVLPAGSGIPEMVTLGPEDRERLGRYLESVIHSFDVVLVDTAAGIGQSVLWLNNFSQHSIIVLTSDPTSLTDAYALVKVLSRDYGLSRFSVVINFTRSESEGRETFKTLHSAAKKFLQLELRLLGMVPEDRNVREAIRKQHPVIQIHPESRASRAFFLLAEKISGLMPVKK